MASLEELYVGRVKSRNDALRAEIEKYEIIRDKKLELCQRFFDEISFLNNYGFKWRIHTHCNNGSDCRLAKYEWRVLIVNSTTKTSPFESLEVEEFDGQVKARFEPTILGRGRYVKGQDRHGYFTAEQLIIALS